MIEKAYEYVVGNLAIVDSGFEKSTQVIHISPLHSNTVNQNNTRVFQQKT